MLSQQENQALLHQWLELESDVELWGFGVLDDEQLLLRPENRAFLQQEGYHWFVSLALPLSESVCRLLTQHNDAGLIQYFTQHTMLRGEQISRAATALSLYIEQLGYKAMVIPGHPKMYSDGGAPVLASQIALARRAGLGSIGDSGMLLTEQWGPRIRLAAVLTSLPLTEANQLREDLCLHCGLCQSICPVAAMPGLRFDPEQPTQELRKKDSCWPYRSERIDRLGSRFCNLCQAVCPVGQRFRNFPQVVK